MNEPHPISEPATSNESGNLTRALSLPQAIALNIANMVGIGPFVTIPLFIKSMNGPHAMIAWVIAALLVMCDGLIWSELGAALPGSGGTYHFHKETFGKLPSVWGRLIPFLFIWTFLFCGPLEMASAYLGTVNYLAYVFPQLQSGDAESVFTMKNWIAAAGCFMVTVLLCRKIHIVGWMGLLLCVGTFAAVLTIIGSGFLYFDRTLLEWPAELRDAGPSRLTSGLGAAMTIAIYDYLGYYNVCHLGEEVRSPGKTIPRAVMISIVVVAAIYMLMNFSIIGVIPWQDAMESQNIAADFMELLYGRKVAIGFTSFVIWASVAGMFALTLGYSRIPYAAAKQGDFFAIFGELHAVGRYPAISLWTLGVISMVCCFLPLQRVIEGAVTMRIGIQFIMQIFGLHLLRKSRSPAAMPFRMWFYPVPSLLALVGWWFLFVSSDSFVLGLTVVITVVGVCVFFLWDWRRKRAELTR